MTLKRKASFSLIASPNAAGTVPGEFTSIDETPKYLNSRTRKRFRDNRPDDEIVYRKCLAQSPQLCFPYPRTDPQLTGVENTLRWLFSAQQQPHPDPPADEDTSTEPLPLPETIDPRQQTLHRFFQPAQPSSFRSRAIETSAMKNSDRISVENSILSRHVLDMDSAGSSVTSDTNSSNVRVRDGDIDSEMGVANG